LTWGEIGTGSGVWYRSYAAGPAIANCLVIDIGDGKLAVLSPSKGTSDADFDWVDAKGTVTALVAPNGGHDMGQPEWQARYPDAGCYGPPEGLGALNKLGLRTFEPISELSTPDEVRIVEAHGSRVGSIHMSCTRGGRPVVYVDELVSNNPELPSSLMFKFMFWLTGSGPGLSLNYLYNRLFVRDRKALVAAIQERLVGDPIVLCAHGDPITEATDVATVRADLSKLTAG
jgi:hypothetical protein